MKIVSFSGIDGAGKTTQICALQSWLREAGLRSKLLTFWDDIVAGSSLRERASLAAFKGDRGIGSSEKPLVRRDKNVVSWPVTTARFFLYFADAVNARRKVGMVNDGEVDVLILDRYIYDELANLPLNRRLTRAFIWLVAKVVRKPDIAFVIDADPAGAFARKPEYPLDFLRKNREAYLTLARITGQITVIEPLPIEDAKLRIREILLRKLATPETGLFQTPAMELKD